MRAGLAAAMVLALASPALADNAKPRDGGSSGSSGSESRHPSPSASSSSGSSSDSGSHGGSGSSSGPISDAERRHPRPGTGHGRHGYYSGYYSYPYYPYSHYYYGGYPYYGTWGWGYWGYYPSYSYGYGYGYGYRNRGYRDYGSVRVLVEPEETRVYVDGYYAGVADDFDGIFQRLHITPGRHEITLKLEGYRTHRMKVYVPPDETLKIHHDMVKGSGEDAVEDLAGPPDRYADDRSARERDRDRDADDGDDDDRTADRDRAADRDRGSDRDARGGAIRLTVRPDDASIYVDGSFRGSGRQVRNLALPPGRHRIEVVRPGFKTYDREVDIDGRGVDLDVELERP